MPYEKSEVLHPTKPYFFGDIEITQSRQVYAMNIPYIPMQKKDLWRSVNIVFFFLL